MSAADVRSQRVRDAMDKLEQAWMADRDPIRRKHLIGSALGNLRDEPLPSDWPESELLLSDGLRVRRSVHDEGIEPGWYWTDGREVHGPHDTVACAAFAAGKDRTEDGVALDWLSESYGRLLSVHHAVCAGRLTLREVIVSLRSRERFPSHEGAAEHEMPKSEGGCD